MNTKSYSEKLRDPRWQRKRLEVLNRDEFTCQLCSDKDTELQVHHLEYKRGNDPWEYDNSNLTTLCKDCHGFVSDYKGLVYPAKVIKHKLKDGFAFFAVNESGLTLDEPDRNFQISHNTLRGVVQMVINYWLLNDNQNFLTDKNGGHDA